MKSRYQLLHQCKHEECQLLLQGPALYCSQHEIAKNVELATKYQKLINEHVDAIESLKGEQELIRERLQKHNVTLEYEDKEDAPDQMVVVETRHKDKKCLKRKLEDIEYKEALKDLRKAQERMEKAYKKKYKRSFDWDADIELDSEEEECPDTQPDPAFFLHLPN